MVVRREGQRRTPRPLVPVALALAGGILLGMRVPLPWWAGWWCAAAGLAAARLRRWPRATRQAALLAAVAAAGVVLLRWQEALPSWHIAHRTTATPRTVALRGIVVDDPAVFWDAWGRLQMQVTLQAEALQEAGRWSRVTGRVRCTLVEHDVPLRYGDTVVLEGALQQPRKRRPHDAFDARAYWTRQGVYALLRVPAYEPALVLRRGGGHGLWRLAFRARAWARRLFRRALDGGSGALLSAMLLGDRAGLDRQTREAFVRTGTVHILSVSGLHVGLLAALLLGFLRLWRLPAAAADALVLVWLVAYAILTGGRVPVVRATMMMAAWLIARRLERRVDLLQVLALAAIGVLCWQPRQLADPGFQLSFGSVLSIGLCVPLLERYWPMGEPSRSWSDRLQRWGRASVLVSLGCWLGIAPLIAWHYRLCAPVTVLANLVVIPLLGGSLGLGLALVAAGLLGDGVAAVVAAPTSWTLHLLLSAVAWLARVPGGWWMLTPPWWVIALWYGLLTWWARRALRRSVTESA